VLDGAQEMDVAHARRGELRAVYLYVTKRANALNLCFSAREAAEKAAQELSVSRLVFYCALMVFQELGLLRPT
jgi:hypothetical protein